MPPNGPFTPFVGSFDQSLEWPLLRFPARGRSERHPCVMRGISKVQAMARTFRATEDKELDETLAYLPATEAYVKRVLARFRPFISLEPPARVLDVGAAQGVTVAAFCRAGFAAAGVEPSPK